MLLTFLSSLLVYSVLYIGIVRLVVEGQTLIWPLPSGYEISSKPNLWVSNEFEFVTKSSSEIIEKAMERYMYLTFPHNPESNPPSNVPKISQLIIQIADDNEDTLEYGMDESYDLSFPNSTQGVLKANTVWGGLRGLETFSQIVIYNFTLGYYMCFDATIIDKPRFSHRGLLVDTSRHFQSMDSLKQVIEAMSYSKFNVLHWHIVDSQSFPYESKAFPLLWNGAYTVYERYSQNDVREIVAYAKDYGIRVIPEFDMPGHAQSWCVGYPQICPSPQCNSPLNPANNFTWTLIDGLIGEASSDVFIDKWIHLGGDEVSTTCWTTTPSVETWLTANNFTAEEAYGYFVERAMDIAYYKYGLQVINWVEVFNNFNTSLNRNVTVIEVWKAEDMLAAATEMGFRAILADSDLWYLDHLDVTWQQMYMNEPFSDINNKTQQMLVLGGEGCMWGETVDVSDIEQTIWPRAAAIAERLWSPAYVNNTQDALPRIEYFRCLLNERGIAAAPVNNMEARQPPPGPGSCYAQRR